MSERERTCGNCKYERDGTCHRFPPVVTYAPTYAGDFVPVFPTVDGNDWCGEFAISHLDDEACAGLISDSMEQVALDMLALIKAARRHPIALDPNSWAGGQMIYPLPEQTFEDRLRELGIEVGE